MNKFIPISIGLSAIVLGVSPAEAATGPDCTTAGICVYDDVDTSLPGIQTDVTVPVGDEFTVDLVVVGTGENLGAEAATGPACTIAGICVFADVDPSIPGIQTDFTVVVGDEFTVDLVVVGTGENLGIGFNQVVADLSFDDSIVNFDDLALPLAGEMLILENPVTPVVDDNNPASVLAIGGVLVNPQPGLELDGSPPAGTTGDFGFRATNDVPQFQFGNFGSPGFNGQQAEYVAITGLTFTAAQIGASSLAITADLSTGNTFPVDDSFDSTISVVEQPVEIPESSNWLAMLILLGLGYKARRKIA